MKIKKMNPTEQKVFELTQPSASELGLDIWDIRLEKEGALWYLRVFIDKEEGISIDDCEALNKPLNKILDDEDPIPQSYILEVGSAGLERELIRENHFSASCGKDIKVHMIRPLDNEKDFTGVLESFSKESIVLHTNDSSRKIMFSDISYVKLYEEF